MAVDGPAAVTHSLTHITLANVFATLFTAYLASLVGFGIWNSLMARYPAAVVTPFALLVPVFGMTAAFLLQGERPGPAEVAGGVVLLLGVAVTLRGGRRVRSAASRNAEAPQPVTV
jgi:O-acetylserine/cysteine efflux transporter